MGFLSGITQNVIASVINSHVAPPGANIAPGAYFTGLAESTLGVNAIQVNLAADQNCTVFVEQSGDGTNWDVSDQYTYLHAKGGQAWTTQATSAYYRVRVRNDGASATTYVRLVTALCPIVEAVPRSLTADGNLRVAVNEMLGTYGTSSRVTSTPMGQIRTSETTRLVGAAFQGTVIDPNFWTQTATGSGGATQAQGEITLSTGGVAGGGMLVRSTRTARYVAGAANFFRAVVRLPAVTGANTRRWGAFTANDGYMFVHDGTRIGIASRKAGVESVVWSGSFNGDYGEAWVPGNGVNTYEIHWTNSSAWFSVGGVTLHKLTGSTTPLTDTNAFQISAECANDVANAAANTLIVRVASISRHGFLETNPIYFRVAATGAQILKHGPGLLHKVIVGVRQNGSTLTIYDNTTNAAPIILEIDTANALGNIDFRVPFNTGLTVVASNANVRACVVYE